MTPVTVRIIDNDTGDGGDGDDGGGGGDGDGDGDGDGAGGDGGGGGDGDGDGDDDPPGLSIDDAPAVREGESAAFVVRLSASSDKLVTVAYETMDGTAVAGADYTSTSGTLRFDAGDTRMTLAEPTLEATRTSEGRCNVDPSWGDGDGTTGTTRRMIHRGCRLTMRRRCAKASRRRSSCG